MFSGSCTALGIFTKVRSTLISYQQSAQLLRLFRIQFLYVDYARGLIENSNISVFPIYSQKYSLLLQPAISVPLGTKPQLMKFYSHLRRFMIHRKLKIGENRQIFTVSLLSSEMEFIQTRDRQSKKRMSQNF